MDDLSQCVYKYPNTGKIVIKFTNMGKHDKIVLYYAQWLNGKIKRVKLQIIEESTVFKLCIFYSMFVKVKSL